MEVGLGGKSLPKLLGCANIYAWSGSQYLFKSAGTELQSIMRRHMNKR